MSGTPSGATHRQPPRPVDAKSSDAMRRQSSHRADASNEAPPASGHSELDRILAPVTREFAEVDRRINEALASEIPGVDAVGTYLARTKGKGIRPALTLLVAQALGPITDDHYRAAVGMELLQISTLLHDDVIDQSPLRRGKPSVNASWSNGIAVLMGDLVFTHALTLFTETNSVPIMHAAARQARLMLEGEVAAREMRGNPDFLEDTYMSIIRRKTGALMALACELPALLSDADDVATEHLRSFGENLGLAFQIADDILDVTGDPTVVGKPTGQDIREGTVTLPLVRALAAAPEPEADAMRERVRSGIKTDDDWESVKSFITAYGGAESAMETAHHITTRSREHLNVLVGSTARQSLTRLLGYVVKRKT